MFSCAHTFAVIIMLGNYFFHFGKQKKIKCSLNNFFCFTDLVIFIYIRHVCSVWIRGAPVPEAIAQSVNLRDLRCILVKVPFSLVHYGKYCTRGVVSGK